MSATWHRWAARFLLSAAVCTAVVWGVTTWRPFNASLGRLQLGALDGRIHLVLADAPLQGDGRMWRVPSGGRVLIGPESRWRPSMTTATITVNGATASLRGAYAPLPFLLALLTIAWLVTAWLRPRPSPHVCRSCGYDLTGCPSDRCPECGRLRPGRTLSVLLAWACQRTRQAPARPA